MGFFSFMGRVLFSSLFILSAWQMNFYQPTRAGLVSQNPYSQIEGRRYNDFGDDGGPAAKEFAPKLTNFHNSLSSKFGEGTPKMDVRHLVAALIVLKGLGGLLFVFGSSLGAYFLLSNLAITTPLLFDFYNYNPGDPKFLALLQEFLLYLPYCGALLFFIGMKYSLPRKQVKKKTPKAKTN